MTRAAVTLVVLGMFVALIARAQRTADADTAPIVIQGAMSIEVQALAARLTQATTDRVSDWTFWRGTIDGYPVIVSKTLKGVANAAAATAIAAERYHPAAILNQGTAGGHDPALHLYDIVVGREAVSLGAFRSTFRPAGTGTNPLEWRPFDLTAADGSAANDPNARRIARFAADPQLLSAARAAIPTYGRGQVKEGTIGSSDMWNDEIDLIARFHHDYGTAVEDMETASAAQVARQLNVPFLGVRVVSDNVTNGDKYDPKTAASCEEYVYQVVKTYIAKRR